MKHWQVWVVVAAWVYYLAAILTGAATHQQAVIGGAVMVFATYACRKAIGK